MNENPVDIARKVLPRWRPIARTPAHELASPYAMPAKVLEMHQRMMTEAQSRWSKSNDDLREAAELLDAATMTGQYAGAVSPALIVVESPNALPGMKRAALQILGRIADRPPPILQTSSELNTDEVRTAIRCLKARVVDMPRDVVSILEIARLQSLIGQAKSAYRYVDRALSIEPDNRYVLRSATRFLVHGGDVDRALAALRASEVISSDPWVQSAEIATADIDGRPSRYTSKVKQFLIKNEPKNIKYSELASGIATLELSHGGHNRQARKLLRLSLATPTENALAQALWVRETGQINFDLNVGSHLQKLSDAHEARARAAYDADSYDRAIEECWLWLEDEPFSPRAAIAGAYVCSALTGKYLQALNFTDAGLRANPTHRFLLNGRLVALALAGKIDDAEAMLPAVEQFEDDPHFAPFVHAARGLIAFKRSNYMGGRNHYLQAIEASRILGSHTLAANAATYWLEQEVSSGTILPDDADRYLAQIDDAAKRNGKKEDPLYKARRAIISAGIEKLRQRSTILQQVSEGIRAFLSA